MNSALLTALIMNRKKLVSAIEIHQVASLSQLLCKRMKREGRVSAVHSPRLCYSPVSTQFPESPASPSPLSPGKEHVTPAKLWLSPFHERLLSPKPKCPSKHSKPFKGKTLLSSPKSQSSFDFFCTSPEKELSALKRSPKTLGMHSLHAKRRLLRCKIAGKETDFPLNSLHFPSKTRLPAVHFRPFPLPKSSLSQYKGHAGNT